MVQVASQETAVGARAVGSWCGSSRYSLCLASRMARSVARKCRSSGSCSWAKFYLSTPWCSKYFSSRAKKLGRKQRQFYRLLRFTPSLFPTASFSPRNLRYAPSCLPEVAPLLALEKHGLAAKASLTFRKDSACSENTSSDFLVSSCKTAWLPGGILVTFLSTAWYFRVRSLICARRSLISRSRERVSSCCMAMMLRQLSSLWQCRVWLSRSLRTSSQRFQLLVRSSPIFRHWDYFYWRSLSLACRSHSTSRSNSVFQTVYGGEDSTRASEGMGRVSTATVGWSGWANCCLRSSTSLYNFRISIWKCREGSSFFFGGYSLCCLMAWVSLSKKARSLRASSYFEDEPFTLQYSSPTYRQTPPCLRHRAYACSLATRLIPSRSSSGRVYDLSRDYVCILAPTPLLGPLSCCSSFQTLSTCVCEWWGNLRVYQFLGEGIGRRGGSCVVLEKCMDLLISMHNIIMSEVSAKVVVIGAVGVGKSSLTVRYVRQQFTAEMESTLGAVYFEKQLALQGQKIKFQFWDTAGQERYKSIARIYYKDCRVALVVYDVTSRPSFEAMKSWVQELKANGPQDVVLAIVGNKIDLESTEGVSYEEAQSYAASLGAIFKYTSAKDGKGVQELFVSIGEVLLQRAPVASKNEKLKRSQSKKGCC